MMIQRFKNLKSSTIANLLSTLRFTTILIKKQEKELKRNSFKNN